MKRRNKERRAYLKHYASDKIDVYNRVNKKAMSEYPVFGNHKDWSEIPPTITEVRKEWQGRYRFSGDDVFHSIVWIRAGRRTLKLFFCGEKHFWTREVDGVQKEVSVIYASKDRALLALELNKILWL